MSAFDLKNTTDLSSLSSRTATIKMFNRQSVDQVPPAVFSKEDAPVLPVSASPEIARNADFLTKAHVEFIAKTLEKYNTSLHFKVSEHSKTNIVIEVRTISDGELVRQIPQEELLTLSERLSELDGFNI